MAYTHKGKANVPSTVGAEHRLDYCIHGGIHKKTGDTCDPENVLGIEAHSIEAALDGEGNMILKVMYVIPMKDIP